MCFKKKQKVRLTNSEMETNTNIKHTNKNNKDKVKGAYSSSQSYRASLTVWDHTVLPDTQHK